MYFVIKWKNPPFYRNKLFIHSEISMDDWKSMLPYRYNKLHNQGEIE